MYRMFKTLPSVATACVLAATLAACNGSPNAPSSSTAAGAPTTEAGPNGETLKVQAPALVSPANDLRLDNRRPTLVANAVAGKFVGGSYSYEFELLTDGNARVDGTTLSQTTWAYPTDLERDTAYRWRVRARMGNAVGPWSAARRFITLLEKRAPDPRSPAHGCRCPTWPTSSSRSRTVSRPRSRTRARSTTARPGWEFMDRVIDALRLEDTRWGYNWKRGDVGDPIARRHRLQLQRPVRTRGIRTSTASTSCSATAARRRRRL